MERKKLSDLLGGKNRELTKAWQRTEPAKDFEPLPAGEYIAHIVDGQATEAQTGTPSYKLTFKVAEGELRDRRFWHDLWLTEQALPMTKRDLAKLGVTQLEQLDKPLPKGMRSKVRLALWTEDDGRKYNRVRSFEVIGIDKPEVDPFAPKEPQAPAEGQGEGQAA
jgi:hypothetical protein